MRSENFKILLIRDGTAQLHGRFGVRTVTSGDLVFLRSGVECGSVSLSPINVVAAYLNPAFVVDQLRWTMPELVQDRRAVFREMVRAVPDVRSMRLTGEQFGVLHEQFDRLAHLSARGAGAGERVARATELIWQVSEVVAPSSEATGSTLIESFATHALRVEIHEVLRLLHDDFANGWTVADMARSVALSESALRRAFTAATGLTPRRYLNRVRLARFEELVTDTTMTIAEATRRVGWSSTAHARQVFAQGHGMSPRAYRRKTLASLERGYFSAQP